MTSCVARSYNTSVCSETADVHNGERLKKSALPYPAATSDERAHVEVGEDRVAVHRAEWAIQGCEDEIGRVYDELPEGGW